MRLVGFSLQQQIQLNELHKAKSPVHLTNCQVKQSHQGQGLDVLLKSNTHISKSKRKLDMSTLMTEGSSKVTTLDAISNLSTYAKVSLDVKVLEVHAVQEVGDNKKERCISS